jgi:hypothetical protein
MFPSCFGHLDGINFYKPGASLLFIITSLILEADVRYHTGISRNSERPNLFYMNCIEFGLDVPRVFSRTHLPPFYSPTKFQFTIETILYCVISVNQIALLVNRFRVNLII